MSIVRIRHHAKPFTTIDNRTLRDIRLSLKARGLLAYLLSLPPDTAIDRDEIAKDTTDGVRAIRSGLQELAQFGYVTYRKVQGQDGRWRTEATVWERPEDIHRQDETSHDRRHETRLRSDQGLHLVSAGRTGGTVTDGPKRATKELRRTSKKKEEEPSHATEPETNPEGAAKARQIIEMLAEKKRVSSS